MEKVYLYKNNNYNYNDFYILGQKRQGAFIFNSDEIHLEGTVIYSYEKSFPVGKEYMWFQLDEVVEVDPKTLPLIAQTNILRYL